MKITMLCSTKTNLIFKHEELPYFII